MVNNGPGTLQELTDVVSALSADRRVTARFRVARLSSNEKYQNIESCYLALLFELAWFDCFSKTSTVARQKCS